MNRRALPNAGSWAALLAAAAGEFSAQVPVHNFDHCDFGPGVSEPDRLY